MQRPDVRVAVYCGGTVDARELCKHVLERFNLSVQPTFTVGGMSGWVGVGGGWVGGGQLGWRGAWAWGKGRGVKGGGLWRQCGGCSAGPKRWRGWVSAMQYHGRAFPLRGELAPRVACSAHPSRLPRPAPAAAGCAAAQPRRAAAGALPALHHACAGGSVGGGGLAGAAPASAGALDRHDGCALGCPSRHRAASQGRRRLLAGSFLARVCAAARAHVAKPASLLHIQRVQAVIT